MANDSCERNEQELQKRTQRAMQEALYQLEEQKQITAYYQNEEEKMYCAWRAEQEKVRFLQWKQSEKREYSGNNFEELSKYKAIYCKEYYRSNYPEVVRNHGGTENELLNYFLSEGLRRGHQGTVGFNVWSYRTWNPDLESLFGDDLEKYYDHYMKEGVYQKRRAFGMPEINEQTLYNGVDYEPVYRFYDYLYYNPDVLETIGLIPDQVLKHFVEYGMDEKRRSRTDFYVVQYRRQYEDLRAAFGDQYRKYYEHYLRDGRKEGRKGIYEF